jgi:hypothetical protein
LLDSVVDANISVASFLMEHAMSEPVTGRLSVEGTDLEVAVNLDDGELTIVLTKGNARVYRVVVEQATMPIENAWLSDV